jgi:hypothetical protein
MAISSAWPQSPQDTGRGKCSRHSSGRFLPVATPTLADRFWIRMPMTFAVRTTHSRR